MIETGKAIHNYENFLFTNLLWQVFSKLQPQPDSEAWNESPHDGRNPLLEPFWLQLLSLAWDPELGEAACLVIVGAARQRLGLAQARQALATLFSSPRSLYAAAGVFSELAWQIQSRAYLQQVFMHVQERQVCDDSRCLARSSSMISKHTCFPAVKYDLEKPIDASDFNSFDHNAHPVRASLTHEGWDREGSCT